MKKIVAKHEDVMGFFKKIKVGAKVKNKNNAEKFIDDGQNNNIVDDIAKNK